MLCPLQRCYGLRGSSRSMLWPLAWSSDKFPRCNAHTCLEIGGGGYVEGLNAPPLAQQARQLLISARLSEIGDGMPHFTLK